MVKPWFGPIQKIKTTLKLNSYIRNGKNLLMRIRELIYEKRQKHLKRTCFLNGSNEATFGADFFNNLESICFNQELYVYLKPLRCLLPYR